MREFPVPMHDGRGEKSGDAVAGLPTRSTLAPILLAALFSLVGADVVSAGVPMPHAFCGLSQQPLACQWRFRYGRRGTSHLPVDVLTLRVTLRGPFDPPLPGVLTSCTLTGASMVAKSCGGDRRVGVSNADGTVNFVFGCIGGRGSVDLRVSADTAYGIATCSRTIQFTSTDLDASRDTDGGATNVIDLGIFAGGIPPSPYLLSSDYDCNGNINVIDLGVFAGGLGRTCADCP